MPQSAISEWRNHWRVVAGTFLGMSLAYPSWSYVQSQFILPLQNSFHWSKAQISFAFGVNLFVCFVAPMLGRLIDRVGVQKVLLPSLVFVSLSYVVLANSSGSYPAFIAACLFGYVAGIGTTGVAYTRAVVSWFAKSRGAALAVSRVGMSLIGAVLPAVVYSVIHAYGWRAGFYLMGAVCLFISLPVSYLWVRDRRPSAEEAAAAAKARPPEWRLWLGLLSNHRVLLLCLAAACTYGPSFGVLSQLQPLLVSKGIQPHLAADLASILAISVLVGTLGTGLLVDRMWVPLLGCIFTLLPVAGCALLLLPHPGELGVSMAIGLVGLAIGAEIDVVAYLVARYFGLGSYSAIYSLTVLTITVINAVAGIVFGWTFDRTGSYGTAIVMSAVVFAVGAVSYLLLGPYPSNADDAVMERA